MIKKSIRQAFSLSRSPSFFFANIQGVKGMKDVVDEDLQKFDFIRTKASKIFKQYGYQEVLPNILEHEEVFQKSLGEGSEIIQKEMYRFQDLSGRKLVLRPEGTAGIARMFIEKGMATSTLPKKLFYIGPMFRYEKPQKGRSRQFYQLGVENLGSSDEFSDIELLSVADSFMKSLKRNPNFYKIEINTLGDEESRIRYSQALTEYFTKSENFERLSGLSKLRLQNNNPLRILDSKEKADIALLTEAPRIEDYLSSGAKSSYERIKDSLTRLNINYVENPSLVRGLDYYTKLCFEIKYTGEDVERTKDTLLGGGRYDLLVGQLSGKKDPGSQVPALGFAAGMERLMLLLDENDEWKAAEREYLKVGIAFAWEKDNEKVNMDLKLKAVEIQRLFSPEDKVVFEAPYDLNKIDKQFRHFEKKNFDSVIILGLEELRAGQVKVKDMKSRSQVSLNLENNFAQNLLKELRNKQV